MLRTALGLSLALGWGVMGSLLAQTPPATAEAPASKILKWKDGKQAVFMVVFDDSPPCDLSIVMPEFEKRKLPATYYINPGNAPFKDRKDKWAEAAKSPYVELANHTFTHKGANTVEELTTELHNATQAIYEATPDRKSPRLVGYGQPGGVPWKVTKEDVAKALLDEHLVERPPFYGLPFHYKSSAELVAVVDKAIAGGAMGHIDFHGVGADWLTVPTEFLTTLLDKLVAEQDKVWVTDTVSWRKYSTERDGSTLKDVSTNKDEIKLELTTTTDPALYDLPLTLSTPVPADWTSATVTQGAKTTTVPAAAGQIRYDALPGKEAIVITTAAAK